MAERVLLAVLSGVAQGALVWAASTAMRLHHVWPGTILSFAMGTAWTLILLRGIR